MLEKRYSKSGRIWVMERGMLSEENIEFLAEEGRRYIMGATKSCLIVALKRAEMESN